MTHYTTTAPTPQPRAGANIEEQIAVLSDRYLSAPKEWRENIARNIVKLIAVARMTD